MARRGSEAREVGESPKLSIPSVQQGRSSAAALDAPQRRAGLPMALIRQRSGSSNSTGRPLPRPVLVHGGPEYRHLVSSDDMPACGGCGAPVDLVRGSWHHSEPNETCGWGMALPVPSDGSVWIVKYRDRLFGVFTDDRGAIDCKKKTERFGTVPVITRIPKDQVGDLRDERGWTTR